MEAHKEREIENDKIFERKMVKEAEAEAHLYGDKEKFVTSAYRRKLEAREAYEAEQKRKQEEEAKGDVTKQDGLMAFHRNLLNDNLEGDLRANSRRDAAYALTSAASSTTAAVPAAPKAHSHPLPSSDKSTVVSDGSSWARDESSGAPPSPEAQATCAISMEMDGAPDKVPSGGMAGGLNIMTKRQPDTRNTSLSCDSVHPSRMDDGTHAGNTTGTSDGELVSFEAAISAATTARAQRAAKEAATAAAEGSCKPVATSAPTRRNDAAAVMSARERYLQRKRQRVSGDADT